MDLQTFTESLKENTPPYTSVYLRSLWYDADDQWKTAHELIDDLKDKDACWLHGYLHRKEGDSSNADYWYARAGKKRPATTLQEEWEQLVIAFLHKKS